MTDPEGIRYIRTLVEGAREYVRHTAVRRSDQFTTHHHAEANHLAWLERPFAEALRALEERGRGRANQTTVTAGRHRRHTPVPCRPSYAESCQSPPGPAGR